MAIAKCPNPTVFQKTLSVNDFYHSSEEWSYPMGHISFVGKLDGETLKAGAPAIAPGWTLELMGKHSLDFWLTSEDLPDPNNRVTSIGMAMSSLRTSRTMRKGTSVSSVSWSGLCSSKQTAQCMAINVMKDSLGAIYSSASGFRSPAWRTRTARFGLGRTHRPAP